ncbi:hypothetical protein F4677DRAFT_445025 [Hypoxylon crocopeplum]|nr:hypothetical protein F4677DRAFT_445025 [Hypoxylon crocopeplum]
MTDWKGIVKKGWRPEKDGTGIRNQVKGLINRGDNSSSGPSNHTAAPISTLRDPSSFGPPPRHVALSGNVAPAAVQSPAPVAQQYQPQPSQTYGAQQHQQQIEEPPAEPRPYRANTTGLSTSHLPPPPARRDSPDRRDQAPPPPPYSAARQGGPPSLPPRLPPRSGNASPAQTPSPVSPGSSQPAGYLNQGAIDRLGTAGISVPGLGIGVGGNPPPPPPARSPAAAPTPGTTWAEKRAALKTASNFRNDPSSVSFADARAAAGTAHSFQQRHGDQVASGFETANGLGQRFGSSNDGAEYNGQEASTSPMAQIAGVIGKKKPPPPPPAKKPQLSRTGSGGGAPPPIPTATRPNFS